MLINEALNTIAKGIANLYNHNESLNIAKIAVKHILKINNLELSLSP
ncbi:MAG: hypothetical protein ACQPRJ_06595 [Solitalea-like symbiont of Acarus siro]